VLVAAHDDVRPRGCGRPRSYVDVRLVDENDIDVKPGEVGEIVVRAKEPWSLMLGYHRMPEETVHAFRNLWLHSGDCAYQDESGQYFFVDRRKDALRRRGENISSFEVERMIISRSDIAEAAVIGVPSEHTEEEMMVFLKLTPGAQFDPEILLHDLSERMPYFMVPRYYEVVDSFPMTPTHKVQKKALRERGVGEATWDYHAAGYRVSRDGLSRLEQV
jgi:crotonobetaine/carnitine-CoA ligase